MTLKSSTPDFRDFGRWIASLPSALQSNPDAQARLAASARAARDQFLASLGNASLEVLELLAAATSTEPSARPPELTTAKGFRVTLAYEDGEGSEPPSICVLVQSPREKISAVQGQTAYLWNGVQRFELGQFDADGKAIGTLPAGVQISMSDFTSGQVKLEAPSNPSKD